MRKRKPSPATIISLVALFFSVSGAGIAAQHYLITSTHQIAPSVLRQLRGATGPEGAAGPAGATGAAGLQGPAGTTAPTYVRQYPSDSPSVSVPAGGSASATAMCLGALAGGGFTAAPGLVVSGSNASNRGDGHWQWTVTATNPTAGDLTLQAQAICVALAG